MHVSTGVRLSTLPKKTHTHWSIVPQTGSPGPMQLLAEPKWVHRWNTLSNRLAERLIVTTASSNLSKAFCNRLIFIAVPEVILEPKPFSISSCSTDLACAIQIGLNNASKSESYRRYIKDNLKLRELLKDSSYLLKSLQRPHLRSTWIGGCHIRQQTIQLRYANRTDKQRLVPILPWIVTAGCMDAFVL